MRRTLREGLHGGFECGGTRHSVAGALERLHEARDFLRMFVDDKD
jgi:hypothetical protein